MSELRSALLRRRISIPWAETTLSPWPGSVWPNGPDWATPHRETALFLSEFGVMANGWATMTWPPPTINQACRMLPWLCGAINGRRRRLQTAGALSIGATSTANGSWCVPGNIDAGKLLDTFHTSTQRLLPVCDALALPGQAFQRAPHPRRGRLARYRPQAGRDCLAQPQGNLTLLGSMRPSRAM